MLTFHILTKYEFFALVSSVSFLIAHLSLIYSYSPLNSALSCARLFHLNLTQATSLMPLYYFTIAQGMCNAESNLWFIFPTLLTFFVVQLFLGVLFFVSIIGCWISPQIFYSVDSSASLSCKGQKYPPDIANISAYQSWE